MANAIGDATRALGGSYTSTEFSDLSILTPAPVASLHGDGRPQEFIVKTPEPGTFAMLGIGLLMLGIFARRKYNRSSERCLSLRLTELKMAGWLPRADRPFVF